MSVPSLGLKVLRWKPVFLVLTALVLVLSFEKAGHAQGLTITTNALPDAVRGSAYSFTVQASGGTGPRIWTAAGLPPGLSIGASTGTISGTTNTMTPSFAVSITVDTALDPPANKNFTLNVNPPLSVTTMSLPVGVVASPYSVSLAATGGTAPYTWDTSAGSLPAGLTLTTAGAIMGTPTTAQTANFTVRVTDSGSRTDTRALSITINAPLSVTTTTLPVGVVGSAYSATLVAAGGTTPYTWATVVGNLPAGLTLNGSTGAITGTPTTAGTSNFTVRVTDSGSRTVQKDLSIMVNPALSVTTTSLPLGVVGSAYSATLVAAGGTTPYTWATVVGNLPAGLLLNTSTGAITGTPTTAGTSNITFRVTDSGSRTATQPLSLTINAALSITTTSLPNGITGQAYSANVVATGGTTPYTWATIVGNLPAGLTLNGSTGAITGTPTTAGTSNFTIRVTDSGARTVQQQLSITIITPLTITTTSLPGGVVGTAYAAPTLAAAGGTLPYTWTLDSGTLPGGLSLSNAGLISGTPTSAGTSTFTVRVTDSGSQTVTQALSISVSATVAITTATLPPGVVGSPYSTMLTAVGGATPYTWATTAGTLPAGLSLAPSTGVISGTPTSGGTSNFTVRVTDNGGRTASQALSISITASLTITTTSLPGGVVGTPYTSPPLAAAGGTTPYAWAVMAGSLPAGLILNPATGVISGTPTATGAISFTVQVTDAGSRTATQALSITINTSLSIVTTSPLPSGTVGSGYSLALQSSGGAGPYTWSTTSGALPPGLSFTPAGVLTGTPTTAGSYNFIAQVRDSSNNTATGSFTISIVSTTFGSITLASSVPPAVNPTQQPEITLVVTTPPSQPISGALTLRFISGGAGAADDPAVQFSTGTATSRTVGFTIPNNSTAVVFPSKVTLLTGTIAGTVVMTADVPGALGLLAGQIAVNPTIPQVMTISAVRVAPNLRVQITGYSPERRMVSADFGFDVRTPSGTQRVPLSRVVDSDFDTWYRDPASVPFGSSFFYEQLFTVQGNVSTVDAVTVTLTNGEGKTTSAVVPFTN